MLNEVIESLSNLDFLPKRLFDVVSGYVFFLTLIMKRHSFRLAAEVVGLHESRFCAMLNDPATPKLSRNLVNRALRRRLKKLKPTNGRLIFIIDATLKRRRSRHVENVRRYHHGSGLCLGHKFVNFVVLDGAQVVPLASIPVLTKKYARENAVRFRSEIEIVEQWVLDLANGAQFTSRQLSSAIFLLDSGYDAKCIQRAIQGIGANFVMALKCSRTINGKRVSEYFRRTKRGLKNQPIRLKAGSGGKGSRRIYSIRTATDATMKGFGLVTVVCSKAIGRKRKPLKYLVTSDLKMTGREIVEWYGKRWGIETWHREMKQNFGFIDCHSSRFTAIESHVNFALIAYILQKASGRDQLRVEQYVQQRELIKMALRVVEG